MTTPLTDKAEFTTDYSQHGIDVVDSAFARTLELENQRLRESNDRLRNGLRAIAERVKQDTEIVLAFNPITALKSTGDGPDARKPVCGPVPCSHCGGNGWEP